MSEKCVCSVCGTVCAALAVCVVFLCVLCVCHARCVCFLGVCCGFLVFVCFLVCGSCCFLMDFRVPSFLHHLGRYTTFIRATLFLYNIQLNELI